MSDRPSNPVTITPEDIAENILAPELESAIFALLQKSGPVKYDDAGIRLITEAVQAAVDQVDPAKMAQLARQANEWIARLLDAHDKS